MGIYRGDKGTLFELEFRDGEKIDGKELDLAPLDISGAAEIIFYFKKPDGSVVTKKKSLGEITFSTNGADGKAQYVAAAEFLNIVAEWEFQGWVQLADGSEHFTDTVGFTVKDTLKPVS